MIDIMIVQEALKQSQDMVSNPCLLPDNSLEDQSSVTSMLIHDIFGGEILKTHRKKGWHFYNRIDGKRIDLAKTETEINNEDFQFEDIPSTTEETNSYVPREDYTTFFMRFVRIFEEYIGLDKFSPRITA